MKKQRSAESFLRVLRPRMVAAQDSFAKCVPADSFDSVCEFFAEDPDAILAPEALLFLVNLRRFAFHRAKNEKERELGRQGQKMLSRLLRAFETGQSVRGERRPKTPKLPPEAKRLQAEIRLHKLAQARALAELAFLRRGEKKTVAFARFAAKLGAVAPKSDAALPSRAPQRAEQRARKKAGEPPRRRGRPPRLR